MTSACKWLLPTLLAAISSAQASAAVVVVEHSGYQPTIDYMVFGESWITILQPSDPGIPYDFDCYDDVTNEPATIQAIMPREGLTGTVDLKVIGHNGREFGAEDVDQIVFNYNGGYGPALTLKEFNIHGILGTAAGVENYVFGIDGEFSAGSMARPFHVFTGLTASMTITGDVPDTAVLQMGKLEAPHSITVDGDFLGDMIFHHDL